MFTLKHSTSDEYYQLFMSIEAFDLIIYFAIIMQPHLFILIWHKI